MRIESITLAGAGGFQYEMVVGASRPTYTWAKRRSCWDETHTLSFVRSLRAEQHLWREVLARLDVFGAHTARMTDPIRALVRLALDGVVHFFEIPPLTHSQGVPGTAGCYGFMRGPVPLPPRPDRIYKPIASLARAQAIVNTLDFTKTPLSYVFRCAGYDDMNWGSPELVTKHTLIEMLAARRMLTYRLFDFRLPISETS